MKTEIEKQGDAWWRLPAGEQAFLRDLRTMIRGAKRSELKSVAAAARRWESRLVFFVKWQLQGKNKGRGARGGDQ